MLEIDRVAYEAEAQYIRQALKTWETQWAKEHNGAKPGRDDIKGNDIAKQYTAYNRIRGILAGKPPKDAKPKPKDIFEERPREKRKPETIATPSKRRAVEHNTPSKTSTQTPISRKLFSPVVPTSIGPTPQRDGRVLGLFDVLEENWPVATPSRRESTAETPRKQKQKQLDIFDDSGSDEEDGRRMGRTPMSSGRRNLLNHFTAPPPPSFVSSSKNALGTTPLKSRSANVNLVDVTPSKSKAPVEFATPAFLRRTTISLDECADGGNNENYMSPPSKLRLPRKPLVRGLSSVLASLRKAEDERLDEELDIMQELEEGSSTVKNGAGPEDLEQQQLEEMEALDNTEEGEGGQKLLGGFDDEGLYDSEPETAHDRGQPLRVYKKKGQKRTHRLVNMKPTRVKRQDEAPANEAPIGAEDAGGDDDDNGGDDDNGDADYTNKTTTTKKTTKTTETAKKTARKVNELAHANFKRLKLKNTGGKGGPRFNSRFRRRR